MSAPSHLRLDAKTGVVPPKEIKGLLKGENKQINAQAVNFVAARVFC